MGRIDRLWPSPQALILEPPAVSQGNPIPDDLRDAARFAWILRHRPILVPQPLPSVLWEVHLPGGGSVVSSLRAAIDYAMAVEAGNLTER